MMEIRERRLAMQDTAIASRDPLTADCVGIEPPGDIAFQVFARCSIFFIWNKYTWQVDSLTGK